MPIEIRELIIKATVNENQQEEPVAPPAATNIPVPEQQKSEIIEQTLAILKRQKER